MESLDLEQHAAIGAHRERGADRLLSRRGAERDDDDLARPGFLLQPQRFLDGELVVRAEDELDAGLVQRLAVRGAPDAGLAVGAARDGPPPAAPRGLTSGTASPALMRASGTMGSASPGVTVSPALSRVVASVAVVSNVARV